MAIALITGGGSGIGAEAGIQMARQGDTVILADIDVEALVGDAMSQADLSGAMATAQGVATNGAWASNDPEHMATYGLMADYAVGEAMDSIDEASAEIAAATAQAEAEVARAAAEAATPDED